MQQVAGLTQLAGELMQVEPRVIDLGWGTLKSAMVNLKDSGFVTPHDAAAQRRTLVDQYVSTFRHVEAGALDAASGALKDLAANIAAWVAPDQQRAIATLIEGQRGKLI